MHERAEYSDVDLLVIGDEKGERYTHKNREPYSYGLRGRGSEVCDAAASARPRSGSIL